MPHGGQTSDMPQSGPTASPGSADASQIGAAHGAGMRALQVLPSAVCARALLTASLSDNPHHAVARVLMLDGAFYTATLGFANEGTEGPFIVIRVSPDFQIQLAPWGARGLAPTLYFNDPNKHPLEIRWYE